MLIVKHSTCTQRQRAPPVTSLGSVERNIFGILNRSRLTVNDKSTPSLLPCGSCRGNTKRFRVPLGFFFSGTICRRWKVSGYQQSGPEQCFAHHECQTRAVIWRCRPVCVAFEWHRQRIWLFKVTQWEMFYFLISADGRERKSQYCTDRNETSTYYTPLAAAVCVTHPFPSLSVTICTPQCLYFDLLHRQTG